MAKPEKAKENGNPNTETAKPFVAAPPPDWSVVGGSVDIDGWYENKGGAVLCGRIVGWLEYDTDMGHRKAVAIQCAEPITVNVKDGQVLAEKTLPKGSVIGLRLSASIMELFEYDRGTPVWVKAEGKRSLKGGKTMWTYMCKVHPKAKRRVVVEQMRTVKPPAESAPAADDDDFDDIPF